jgi:two-component system LytT family response regulator
MVNSGTNFNNNNMSTNNPIEKKLIVYSSGKMLIINEDEILYFEAEGAYCIIVLNDCSKHRVSQNLKNTFNLVHEKSMFVKIHRSYIVNFNAINGLSKDPTRVNAMQVNLFTGNALPVNKSFLRYFKSLRK